MYNYIGKSVLNDHLGSSTDPCYIQNRVIMNRVIKRLRCSMYETMHIVTFHIHLTNFPTLPVIFSIYLKTDFLDFFEIL